MAGKAAFTISGEVVFEDTFGGTKDQEALFIEAFVHTVQDTPGGVKAEINNRVAA